MDKLIHEDILPGKEYNFIASYCNKELALVKELE